jgi:hypothetical protein
MRDADTFLTTLDVMVDDFCTTSWPLAISFALYAARGRACSGSS